MRPALGKCTLLALFDCAHLIGAAPYSPGRCRQITVDRGRALEVVVGDRRVFQLGVD